MAQLTTAQLRLAIDIADILDAGDAENVDAEILVARLVELHDGQALMSVGLELQAHQMLRKLMETVEDIQASR